MWKTPISSELLVYCTQPRAIVVDEDLEPEERLKQALSIYSDNHRYYVDCYRKQRGLVDAVQRRNE